MKKQKKKLKT